MKILFTKKVNFLGMDDIFSLSIPLKEDMDVFKDFMNALGFITTPYCCHYLIYDKNIAKTAFGLVVANGWFRTLTPGFFYDWDFFEICYQ